MEKPLLSLAVEGTQIDAVLSCMALEMNNVFLEFLSACLSSYAPPPRAVAHKEPVMHKGAAREYQIRCTAEKCLFSLGIRLPAIQEVSPSFIHSRADSHSLAQHPPAARADELRAHRCQRAVLQPLAAPPPTLSW